MSQHAPHAPRQDAIEQELARTPFRIGEILGDRTEEGAFVLGHRDDFGRDAPEIYREAEDAARIARYDDRGNYRPLKTAPNLRHGWSLRLASLSEVRLALDLFYPGRLAADVAWREGRLVTTALRATLGRQTGMYRVAARISDQEADELVAGFCRSKGGCLRAICWKRDEARAPASVLLPATKFDPAFDQTGRGEPVIPLLCQEACNLLVAEARKVVKPPAE